MIKRFRKSIDGTVWIPKEEHDEIVNILKERVLAWKIGWGINTAVMIVYIIANILR